MEHLAKLMQERFRGKSTQVYAVYAFVQHVMVVLLDFCASMPKIQLEHF